MPTTPRLVLPYPAPTAPADVPADIQALATGIDVAATVAQGTLAARPAPSTMGRLYMVQGDATAANNGILWWDTGSTWVRVRQTVKWGGVTDTGAVSWGSGDWTPSRTGSGVYLITFTPAFANAPAVLAAPYGTASISAAIVSALSASTCTVSLFNSAGAFDAYWTFQAIGP